MLKKIIFSLFLFTLFSLHGQAITAEQAIKSNDMKLIATFVKNNPNDPKSGLLKRKLISLLKESTENSIPTRVKENTAAVASTPAPAKNLAISRLLHRKETEEEKILNHLLNGNSRSPEALLSVVNSSKCNIVLKIEGRQKFSMSIPPAKKEYILVPKGSYKLSGRICNAPYYNSVVLQRDIELTLRN